MSRQIVRHYPAGEAAPVGHYRAGDVMLTHRDTLIGGAIVRGQRREARRRYSGEALELALRAAEFSHAVQIVASDGATVEALGRGVARGRVEDYREIDYHLVDVLATAEQRARMRRFAEACVGRPYGYLELASLTVALETGFDSLAVGHPGTLICSGLVAQTQCRGEAIFPKDPSWTKPMDLALYYGVRR